MRGGGSWLPFLFLMIGAFVIIKGAELGICYIIDRIRERRHPLDETSGAE